jgi:hypothetical protein
MARQHTTETDEGTEGSSKEDHAMNHPVGIGRMNGKWVFLMKAVLVTTPAAWAFFVTIDLPWRVWITRQGFDSAYHINAYGEHEKTERDCLKATQEALHNLEVRFLSGPTESWKSRIVALEEAVQASYKQNERDHMKIMLSLESIRARLDLPCPTVDDGASNSGPRGSPDANANTAANKIADDVLSSLGDMPNNGG